MRDKKKIGSFFEDNVQDLSFEPNSDVWQRISDTLEKKQKRRFFWFTLVSIILISGALYFLIFQIVPSYEGKTVTKEEIKNTDNGFFQKDQLNTDEERNSVSSANEKNANEKEFLHSSKTKADKNSTTSKKDSLNSKRKKRRLKNLNRFNSTLTKNKSEPYTTVRDTKNKSHDPSFSNSYKIDSTLRDTFDLVKSGINRKVLSEKKSIDTVSKKKIDSTSQDTFNLVKSGIGNIALLDKKYKDSIYRKKIDYLKRKKIDSLKSIKKKRSRKIEIVDEEEKTTQKDSLGKLDFSLQFSPIISTYLNDRNFLIGESQITRKQTRLSYSYRLLFTLPIQEKIKLRFGIAHQVFKYNAQFSPNTSINSFGGLLLSNIDFPRNPPSQDLTNDLDAGTPIDLEHNIRYLQIPLEVSYKLKEEKIGINLITGLDFFILQDDDILLSSQNTEDFLVGRSNFLSKLSIGVHTGIGLEYPISNKLKFQLEPTIIYQLGGYQNDVRNPYPIYFSMYTGLNLRF